MTPEQEDKFRKAWIKQNQMDVIKKPKIAHMHNQDLLKKTLRNVLLLVRSKRLAKDLAG